MTINKDEAINKLRLIEDGILCHEDEKKVAGEVADWLAATSRIAPNAAAVQAEGDLAGWFIYEHNCWVATSSDDPRATKLYRASPAIEPEASELPRESFDSVKHLAKQVAESSRAALAMHQAAAAKPDDGELEDLLDGYFNARNASYEFDKGGDLARAAAKAKADLIAYIEARRSAAAEPAPTDLPTNDEVYAKICQMRENCYVAPGAVSDVMTAVRSLIVTKHAASEAPTHMTGEQVFNFAAPYFAWNAGNWQEATHGTITGTGLLAFTRALLATTTPIAASEAVGVLKQIAAIADLYDEREDDSFELFADAHEKATRITLGQCRAIRAYLAAPAAPTDANKISASTLLEKALIDLRNNCSDEFLVKRISSWVTAAIQAVESETSTVPAAPTLPDGYQLVMIPKAAPDNVPDYDECARQADEATGLTSLYRNPWMNIFIREINRWCAHRDSADAGVRDKAQAVIDVALEEATGRVHVCDRGNNDLKAKTLPEEMHALYHALKSSP